MLSTQKTKLKHKLLVCSSGTTITNSSQSGKIFLLLKKYFLWVFNGLCYWYSAATKTNKRNCWKTAKKNVCKNRKASWGTEGVSENSQNAPLRLRTCVLCPMCIFLCLVRRFYPYLFQKKGKVRIFWGDEKIMLKRWLIIVGYYPCCFVMS